MYKVTYERLKLVLDNVVDDNGNFSYIGFQTQYKAQIEPYSGFGLFNRIHAVCGYIARCGYIQDCTCTELVSDREDVSAVLRMLE